MIELRFTGSSIARPYHAKVDVTFSTGSLEWVRPAFWDGGVEWAVRFNPPVSGTWNWRTSGLPGGDQSGTVEAEAWPLLRMSNGGRSFEWTDGRPFFPVADTAWALPFRATLEEAQEFADDRKAKGFTAAMLMTVQPDMRAGGPNDPTLTDGFARGFLDLEVGHLNEVVPEYFHALDTKIGFLLDAGIVPIHTPLFYGFGWKGLDVIGPKAVPGEAAWFVRYLLARYGAWPAIWQVGADGTGWEPAVEAMGRELAATDAAQQPRGIHYNPWQACDAHWNADWCHFHLCQTGHGGDHLPDRVTHLAARSPVRAVANGEPTYEGMSGGGLALGEWQADEAWANLAAGGTLGCWYGAGSLWQWKREGETAWGNWSAGPWDWRTALHLPGSVFPGLLGRALAGYDFADMTTSLTVGHHRVAVAKPGVFALIHLPDGGDVEVETWGPNVPWRALDALTLEPVAEGTLTRTEANAFMGERISLPRGRALVVLVGHRPFDATSRRLRA